SNSLWLTNNDHVYRFDLLNRRLLPADEVTVQKHIKSVSSGSGSHPVIVIKPKESWWTDEVIDIKGNRVFRMDGLKIYKARWMLPVPFSYPENNEFKL